MCQNKGFPLRGAGGEGEQGGGGAGGEPGVCQVLCRLGTRGQAMLG